jgi:hypothetical protein
LAETIRDGRARADRREQQNIARQEREEKRDKEYREEKLEMMRELNKQRCNNPVPAASFSQAGLDVSFQSLPNPVTLSQDFPMTVTLLTLDDLKQ